MACTVMLMSKTDDVMLAATVRKRASAHPVTGRGQRRWSWSSVNQEREGGFGGLSHATGWLFFVSNEESDRTGG